MENHLLVNKKLTKKQNHGTFHGSVEDYPKQGFGFSCKIGKSNPRWARKDTQRGGAELKHCAARRVPWVRLTRSAADSREAKPQFSRPSASRSTLKCPHPLELLATPTS